PEYHATPAPEAGGDVRVHGDEVQVCVDGDCWELTHRPRFAPKPAQAADESHPGAPMPGRIVSIACEPGQRVEPGQPLLVLEAMKMEYTLTARTAGVVERVHYTVGDMVDAEVPLVDIKADG